MAEPLYWIWHQQMFGVGTARSHNVMEEWPDPEALYAACRAGEAVLTGGERILAEKAMERAKRILHTTLKKGCDVITPDHPDYPPMLLHSYSKPAALYVKGDLGCLRDNLPIAMVGSRSYTEYGEKAAEYLAEGLACYGATVVSGLAKGIDSFCHGGALSVGGKTVGVLACGLDIDYPRDSAALKRAIRDNGAVVSEYPMGTEPFRSRFPVRNRVIAGMCRGVVVVEAGEDSGALITARLAADMDREVFAVPGGIFKSGFAGANRLIQEGAKLVTSPMDILMEYPEFAGLITKKDTPQREVSKPEPQPLPADIDPNVQKVYDAVETVPATADSLAMATGQDIGDVLYALTELELLGVIASHPGGLFTRF
ncbi:MAG: DNA-processing protein DprA [Oscillospiraceae bacterium]